MNATEVNKEARFAIITARNRAAIRTSPRGITKLFTNPACEAANQPFGASGTAATATAQQTAACFAPVGRGSGAGAAAGGFLALTGDGVTDLTGGTICIGGAIGAGFALARIGVTDLASGASHTTIQTGGCFDAHHGVIADFAFSTI